MRVEVGELAPSAHVRRLIQDPDERSLQSAAGGSCREFFGGLNDGNGECGDEWPSGASPFPGEAVEGAAVADEGMRVEVPAIVVVAGGRDSLADLAVSEAERHLLRRAVDAAALFLGGGDDAGDLLCDQGVSVLAENPDWCVIGGPGQPRVDGSDRPAVEGACKQQPGEEILAGGVKVNIGFGAGVSGAGGEVLGELRGFDFVGDLAEGAPPPGEFFERDRLRVEHPHGPVLARTSRVASTTSRLLEVTSTPPGASRIAGTARLVVLPVRAPRCRCACLPMTRTARVYRTHPARSARRPILRRRRAGRRPFALEAW